MRKNSFVCSWSKCSTWNKWKKVSMFCLYYVKPNSKFLFVDEGILLSATNEKSAKSKFLFLTKRIIFSTLHKFFLFVVEANEKSVNLDLRYPRKMSDVQDIQKKFNDILDSKGISKPLIEDVDEEIETLPMLPDPIKAEENMFQSKKMVLKKKSWRSFFFSFLGYSKTLRNVEVIIKDAFDNYTDDEENEPTNLHNLIIDSICGTLAKQNYTTKSCNNTNVRYSITWFMVVPYKYRTFSTVDYFQSTSWELRKPTYEK